MKKGWLIAEGIILAAFLFLDLTGRAAAASLVKYVGIVLCFLMALWFFIRGWVKASRNHVRMPAKALWMMAALFFTLLADTFLILLDTEYALGVFFFCAVQSLYAFVIGLDLRVLLIRIAAFLGLVLVLLFMGEGSLLTILSAYSISQLVLNVIFGHQRTSVSRRMAVALTLFLACDVCVGIRNLPSFFPAFPGRTAVAASVLIWVFYLPSQIGLVLETESMLQGEG